MVKTFIASNCAPTINDTVAPGNKRFSKFNPDLTTYGRLIVNLDYKWQDIGIRDRTPTP